MSQLTGIIFLPDFDIIFLGVGYGSTGIRFGFFCVGGFFLAAGTFFLAGGFSYSFSSSEDYLVLFNCLSNWYSSNKDKFSNSSSVNWSGNILNILSLTAFIFLFWTSSFRVLLLSYNAYNIFNSFYKAFTVPVSSGTSPSRSGIFYYIVAVYIFFVWSFKPSMKLLISSIIWS